MGLMVFFVTALLTGGILVAGLITALVANAKGYRPWFWILSMGPLGLIIMLVKQSLSQAPTPEERERWESQADWTGGILSALTFMTVFMLPMLGAAMFMVARTSLVPAPPLIAPPPPIAQPMTVTTQAAPEAAGDSPSESAAPTATPEKVQDPDAAGNGSPEAP